MNASHEVEATARAFDEFEIDGWSKLGSAYHERLGPLTSRAAPDIVASARPQPSDTLLDVGTGPGYVAAAAARQGLRVTGCDISEPMLRLARTLHPEIRFDAADARALPYGDGHFDIVTSGFVLLHTAMPEVMVAEAVRVLKPGGRFVTSVYDEPAKARFASVFGEALGSVQIAPPPMPPGPGLFDLSSAEKLRVLLSEAGLVDVTVKTLDLSHDLPSAQDLFDSFAESTVRAGTILSAQSTATRQRLVTALAAALEPYRSGDHYEVPVSFLVASGTRPPKESR
ncbi:methyltransferase domain-containing protein [Dactylosporangium sp. NPDC051484]|uniref:class I SAM-dependent methyltransferase n=1 Tax=Dactylosporangium sp. NPDC051484 TaxID=3154942 RepID=UPI00344B7CD6